VKRLRLLFKVLLHGERGYFLWKAEELKRSLDRELVPRWQYMPYLEFMIDIGKEAWAYRMTNAFLRVAGLTLAEIELYRRIRSPDTSIR